MLGNTWKPPLDSQVVNYNFTVGLQMRVRRLKLNWIAIRCSEDAQIKARESKEQILNNSLTVIDGITLHHRVSLHAYGGSLK